jgi:hypothetical protein
VWTEDVDQQNICRYQLFSDYRLFKDNSECGNGSSADLETELRQVAAGYVGFKICTNLYSIPFIKAEATNDTATEYSS